MSKTMSIIAEALSNNREYKNARVNGEAVGVALSRQWSAYVKSALIPAYTVYKHRYDSMGNAEVVVPCDQTALYNAIRPIVDMIGEVNGDRLHPANVAEEFIAKSVRIRVIDISDEMAHARNELRNARKAMSEDESEENVARYEACKAEVARLESLPGNCKRINAIQNDTAFVKAVEIALGDAILHQSLRDPAEIEAEKSAREAERKAKRKANKLAKKSAK